MNTNDIRKVLDCIEKINGENPELDGVFIIDPDNLRFYQSGNIEPLVDYEVKDDQVYIDGDSRW